MVWSCSVILVLLAGTIACSVEKAPEAEGLLPPPTKKLYNPPYPNNPVKPFKIIGNIYYLGMTNYTSYLITTPEGHILLDTLVEPMLPTLRKNIEQLGFKLQDIKIILQAHAHSDHVGALAQLKELTGAQVPVMAEDAEVLADGGRSDFRGDGSEIWKPVRADRILRDGEEVRLGGVTMVAHRTAGHTKGCTAWTTVAEENGRNYNVVFVCSNRVNENILILDNPKYPNMAEDFASGFETLKKLPADVFLASHAFMFNLEEKLKRLEAGSPQNPFIDPEGYRTYVADYDYEFRYRLQQERLAKKTPTGY